MTNIIAVRIYNDAVSIDDFDIRVCFKKFMHSFQRARQVLFIAIQVRENVALRAAESVNTSDSCMPTSLPSGRSLQAFLISPSWTTSSAPSRALARAGCPAGS